MDANSLMFLFAGIAISAAVFALLILFYPKLTERAAGASGTGKEANRALLPFVFYGILAAYRTGERSLREGYPIPSGKDKKKLAGSVYQVLPAKIEGEEVASVKERVSPEQFEQMVQDSFSGFDSFFKDNQTHFDSQFESWKKDHPRA